MTRAQALAEARRRWGRSAFAVGRRSRMVGVMVNARSFPDGRRCKAHLPKGEGPSWEAAFLDADRREGGAK